MARLYREAPLNNIWEGTSSMMCLDLLRSLSRQPETGEAFLHVLAEGRGADPRLDAAIDEVGAVVADPGDHEHHARWLADRLAAVLAATLLVQHAPPAVAELWIGTRLGAPSLSLTGIDADQPGADELVERAQVADRG